MRAASLSLLMYVALVRPALAQEAPPAVHAGPQAVPAVAADEPILPQQLDGRRAVRGCAVDETCGRSESMRELEVELFPPPGASPWIDERTVTPSSRLEPSTVRLVTKPSELRPDQPWLDQLELPDIPVRWSQKLVDYLVFYKNDPRGRSIISAWLVDQGRYKDMISSHLRKAGLPQDLIYVAMIESSYDPNTLSSAGALGLWQFMPEGGKIYGLRQDRWVDERKDPFRATIAQMDYFHDLYQRFGDWHIALAAFNVGYGAMLRSIARYNTNDYYKLCAYENGLPWETCLYTPKVLATAIVGRNRALFGLDKLAVKAPEAWDEVTVPASVTLASIARAAGASESDIQRLNPHLRRGRTPPGEAGYVVRVPQGRKVATQRKLVDLASDWDGYDAYVVAHGERFEDVATTFGLSTSALRRLNGVEHESEISGGTVLVVPRISADQRAKNQAKAKSRLLGSGIDQKDGEALIVPVPDKDFVVDDKQRVFYRVVTGDTVVSIAKALGISRSQLEEWNGLEEGANLHPKMVLVAFVSPTFDAEKQRVALLDESQLIVVTRGSNEHLDLAEGRTGRARIEYVAPRKEKLEDVAKRYGMGSHDLARINRISYNTVLEKGDKVIVYQVTDPTRSDRAEEQWKKTPRPRKSKDAKKKGTAHAEADDTDRAEAVAGTAGTEDVVETKNETRTTSGRRPDAKADAERDSKVDATTTAKTAVNVKTEAKRTAKADARSDAKPDAKPAVKSDAKVDAKVAGKADAKADTKTDANTDAKTDAAPSSPPKTAAKKKSVAESDGPVTTPAQAN